MNSNILDNTVDKTQIPPLHQKRILAFVNHFVVSSCAFLNDFASKCESKFIEVERKIQKVEASLLIIEAKLSSIPDLNDVCKKSDPVIEESVNKDVEIQPDEKDAAPPHLATPPLTVEHETGVKASDDDRYKKFFKMLHFGVPINAVKLKMQAEGSDPKILDTPDLILQDGICS